MCPSKTLFFRHVLKPPSRRAISSSCQFTSRRHEEESRAISVSVWLDLEKSHIPTNANVFKISQNITSAVRLNGIKGPITITAFGDLLQHLSTTNQQALFLTGIKLTHIPQGVERSLVTDLMYWVTKNPPPAHVFVISSNRDLASVLHRLRMKNYNVLLACNEESASSVMCSAVSMMWDWNGLVKGEDYVGKCFNQPPDSSWYGYYRIPLLDPFAGNTKQVSCSSVETEVCCSVPREVVEEIGLVLSLYPEGALFREVREELRKRNVALDKEFYGYKSFMRLLLSMPEILQVVRGGDGMFLVRACTREIDNKAKVSSENSKDVSVSVEDVKKESQSQESVPVISEMGVKVKDEPVKENQLAFTVSDEVSSSKEKDGVLKKLNRLWFGSPEVELEYGGEKKHVSGSGDECKGVVSEGIADAELGNGKYVSRRILSRVLKRFEYSWGRSNAAASETRVDDIFAKDSFWKDVESFINSPRGFVIVSHSKTRDVLAKNLKEEGPSSLKPLDVSKMLELVSLLVSEKKWIKENSSDALPFRVTRFTGHDITPASIGLRSIITSMSKPQCEESKVKKKSKKPLKRSRSEVMADCHKLIKKITEENPGGYNMGNFRSDFRKTSGYRLNHQSLGYTKLHSLIGVMPEARIESGYIFPSSIPKNKELGPVSEKIHEYEPSDSGEEGFESETDEEIKKNKEGEETNSDLLQILGSWDNVEDDKEQKKLVKSYVYGEDKLVDGILKSLGKKPLGESSVQG